MDDRWDELFGRLEVWRHLPNYQLERRADIFFSLYLREVVGRRVGTRLLATMLPELPIRKGLLDGEGQSNQSVKVDYALFSEDGRKVFFVELKTDQASRRTEQDAYLLRAVELGFGAVAQGIVDVARATTSHRKYHHLLSQLAEVGALRCPERSFANPSASLSAFRAQLDLVTIPEPEPSLEVLYVQPLASAEPSAIGFTEFAEIVAEHDDPLSTVFSESLRRWATVQAGDAAPRGC